MAHWDKCMALGVQSQAGKIESVICATVRFVDTVLTLYPQRITAIASISTYKYGGGVVGEQALSVPRGFSWR